MYQTDWGLSSVIVRAQGGAFGEEGVDLQLPMASLEGKGDIAGRIWGSFLPTGQDGEKRGMCVPICLSGCLSVGLSRFPRCENEWYIARDWRLRWRRRWGAGGAAPS